MDKPKERLNLLFSSNSSLLAKDTGLRLSTTETKLDASTNRDQAMAVNIQTLASFKLDGPHVKMAHGENKEDVGELDECLAFESGIGPPPSVVTQSFCPAAAIARLPYKYMRGKTSEKIGKRFFDKGGFWMNDWDLYYIFPPADLASRALLLLPASQVQQLLDRIGKDFNIQLTLPIDPELGLLLSFQEEGIPQPQYLGRSSNRDTKDHLLTKIPQPNHLIDHNSLSHSNFEIADGTTKAFREKMEAGLNAIKNKSTASRQRKRAEKIERQRQWTQSLKRAQCYLGLHPSRPGLVSSDTRASDETTDPIVLKDPLSSSSVLPKLDPKAVAPFSFVHDPIFICIDIEWNEHSHMEVTEVGISTLDTLDIANVAPGEGGKNWIRWIRSRHIRIKEYSHIVNQDFVSGCPGQFDFGNSEFVSLRDAGRLVESCFRPPYSAQLPVKFIDEAPSGEPKVTIETTIREYKLRPRNIILVGHGLQGDIHHLGVLGCDLFSDNSSVYQSLGSYQYPRSKPAVQGVKPQFLDTLDTANMFQILKRDINPRSLETVLNCLDIVGWNLHNAGNDARYTLEAMIRIIIRARLTLDNEPQELAGNYMDWAIRPVKPQQHGGLETNADRDPTPHEIAWKAEVERRVAEAIAERELPIRDDCKIWEIVTGWDSEHPFTADDIDGGSPKGVIPARGKKQTTQ